MQNLTALKALRNLDFTSRAITALDVQAMAQLTPLTSLRLEDARQWYSSACGCDAATVAEVQHLSLLTNLQQLSITAWQPLGDERVEWYHVEVPVAVPAAAGSCCLPAHGSLTSLVMRSVTEGGMVTWLPSILACTALQRLKLHFVAQGDYIPSTNHLLGGCTEHLTGEWRLAVDPRHSLRACDMLFWLSGSCTV
jgi:hypothetical protein